MTGRAARDAIAVQRNVLLGVLLLLAAASWAWLVAMQDGAGMDMAAMTRPTMGLGWALFLAVWVAMMVAMMFPAAAPMILIFHQVQAGRRQRGEAFVATWIFVAGYLVVWSGAGVVAYAAALAGEAFAAAAGLSAATAARIGGAMLALAGIYQVTPLKDLCLSKCRSPVGFIMTSWREGAAGAFRMGLAHGLWCLGCCWMLFAILFPLGMMNVAAMAGLTALVYAEKSLPWGQALARVAAVGLLGYGLFVIAVPSALPTYRSMPAMTMPTPMAMPPAAGGQGTMPAGMAR